ncbi:MAG: sulfonate ABC transporter substrate-binding protein, partial [Actinobacteria bacterium]|nr:sulfonate ABC transporter substrate-binding protein [Actinomycetota bacterium]
GQVEANRFIADRPDEAKALVNQGITKITGKGLSTAVIDGAWKNLSFTNDPIATSLATSAKHATEVGLLAKADLTGIYDLTLLNEVLRAANQSEVKGQ